MTTIEIGIEEIRAVRGLLSLIRYPSTSDFGHVWLSSDGNRRTWFVSDMIKLVRLEGEPDRETYVVAVLPAAIEFMANLVQVSPHVTVTFDEVSMVIHSLDGVTSVPVCDVSRPQFERRVPGNDEIEAWATVSRHRLRTLAASAVRAEVCALDEDEDPDEVQLVHAWLSIGDDAIGLHLSPDGTRPSFVAPAEDVVGDLGVEIDPRQLIEVLDLFDPSVNLRVGIPGDSSAPVVVLAGSTLGLVMPIKPRDEQLRSAVEDVIRAECGYLAVERDADGDYPLDRRGIPVYARLLHDAEPPTLEVFAVLLTDISPSAELFAELNDLNGSMTYARLFHSEDLVVAEVDLVASTLDAHELRTAITRIGEEARKVMPTLALVFGGSAVGDQVQQRLARYRSTVVDVEFVPGRPVPITGPSAPAEWPFDGSVHVVTGGNPQGVQIGESQADYINSLIAKDVIDNGGRFIVGAGRSPSGDHAESSLIIWGLDRQTVVRFGRKANQDAIFEIDANEVHLVDCASGAVDSWPRTSVHGA